jgi:hypothetical protein
MLALLILLDLTARIKFGYEYRLLSSLLSSFLHSLVIVSLLGLNLSHHTILKHPQPTFLPQTPSVYVPPSNTLSLRSCLKHPQPTFLPQTPSAYVPPSNTLSLRFSLKHHQPTFLPQTPSAYVPPWNTISLRSSLKHPQPTFLPQRERSNFSSIQKNRQNYISVYLNLYIFWIENGRLKILHRKITNISWLQSALDFFLNRISCVRLVSKYLNSPTFQRNYRQTLGFNFVFQSYLERWPCT